MKNLYVHLAEGFEEIEAITIIDVLRRAGLSVISVSLTQNRIVKGAHNIEIKADLLFADVDYSKGMMIILPGGMPGANNLNEHEGLKRQIVEYQNKGLYLAAICAAPIVLGGLGILSGRRAVCYPGYEAHLIGADVQSDPYIVDDKIITGRGIGAALDFSLEIVRILKSEESALELSRAMLVD